MELNLIMHYIKHINEYISLLRIYCIYSFEDTFTYCKLAGHYFALWNLSYISCVGADCLLDGELHIVESDNPPLQDIKSSAIFLSCLRSFYLHLWKKSSYLAGSSCDVKKSKVVSLHALLIVFLQAHPHGLLDFFIIQGN